ncbi:hypothetical protein F5146DRAFT_1001524 [Armillaria mellea]|nr:hypothetical protein F5146DRAFT_1001524 [Armillaria mellea]
MHKGLEETSKKKGNSRMEGILYSVYLFVIGELIWPDSQCKLICSLSSVTHESQSSRNKPPSGIQSNYMAGAPVQRSLEEALGTFLSMKAAGGRCRTLGTRSEPTGTHATSQSFLIHILSPNCDIKARQTQNLAENLFTVLFSCDGEAASLDAASQAQASSSRWEQIVDPGTFRNGQDDFGTRKFHDGLIWGRALQRSRLFRFWTDEGIRGCRTYMAANATLGELRGLGRAAMAEPYATSRQAYSSKGSTAILDPTSLSWPYKHACLYRPPLVLYFPGSQCTVTSRITSRSSVPLSMQPEGVGYLGEMNTGERCHYQGCFDEVAGTSGQKRISSRGAGMTMVIRRATKNPLQKLEAGSSMTARTARVKGTQPNKSLGGAD